MITNNIGPKGMYSKGTIDGSFRTEIVDYAKLSKFEILKSGPVIVSGSLNRQTEDI